MYRSELIAEGEYYHLFNRGVLKSKLFLDTRDYARFLFILLYFQSEVPIFNLSYSVTNFIKTKKFGVSDKKIREILENRIVELVAFAPMPNHFHLIIKEHQLGGISRYMQKVSVAYSKYFNAKYKKTGHVFQGAYKLVHIEDNDQLLYASAYIHKNPTEVLDWKNRPEQYPWSSYQDYIGDNRWGELLVQDIILDQFETGQEYFEWVKNTIAKEDFGNIADE
jgi:putative transposase